MRFFAALVAVLALALGACGSDSDGDDASSGGSSESAQSGGTVNIRLAGEWDTLDIGTFLNPSGSQLSVALYDRLLAVNADSEIVPYLASSWEETTTSIEFTLRDDATCSDGTPVTPTVVADSIGRLIAPETLSPRAARLFGPGPYDVEADDEAGTVTFTVETPFNELAWGFTSPWSGIICPAGLEDPEALATEAFGSGPFTIDSTSPESTTLRVRPEWAWGPEGLTVESPGFPDTLVYKVVPNDTTAANLLSTGELDVAFVGGPDVDRLLADPELQSYVSHSFYSHPLTFNQTEGHVTADPAVREAIMAAIDAEAWNQVAYAGYGVVTSSFLTPDADCYDDSTEDLLPAHDPDGAREVLLDAGYTDSGDGSLEKDGQPLQLRLLAASTYQSSGLEYISEALTDVGFIVDLQNVEHAIVVEETLAGNFDATVSFLPSHTPQPGIYINLLTGPPPPDGFNANRTAMDGEIVEEATAALQAGPDERCEHWARVQQLFLEGHHILPLASPTRHWFTRGVEMTPISADWVDPFFSRVGD